MFSVVANINRQETDPILEQKVAKTAKDNLGELCDLLFQIIPEYHQPNSIHPTSSTPSSVLSQPVAPLSSTTQSLPCARAGASRSTWVGRSSSPDRRSPRRRAILPRHRT